MLVCRAGSLAHRCIVIFALDTLLQRAARGAAPFGSRRYWMMWVRATVFLLVVLDLVWWSSEPRPRPVQRFAPGLRPWVVLLMHANLRHLASTLLSIFFMVFDIFVLGLTLVLWFGLFVYVIFKQFCGPGSPCDESKYFGSIGTSFISVQVLLTTDNYPDLMLEAYNVNRVIVLPFMAFLLFGLFFIMNVVLASTYNQFTRIEAAQRALHERRRRTSLRRAFDELVAPVR